MAITKNTGYANPIGLIIIAFLMANVVYGQAQQREVKLGIETDYWVVGEIYSKKDTTEIEWGVSSETLIIKNATELFAKLDLPQLNTGEETLVLNLAEYSLTFFSLAPKVFIYIALPLQEVIKKMGQKENPFKNIELVGKTLNLSETIAGEKCEWYAVSPINRNEPLKACFAKQLPMDWNYVMNRIGNKDIKVEDKTNLPIGAVLAIKHPKSDDMVYQAVTIKPSKNINIKQKISIR